MPMNKEAEQLAQTPKGVKLQGTVLMCLAIAMIIAGGSVVAQQWLESEKQNTQTMTEEVQLDEEVTDTEGLQSDAVPEPDGSGLGSGGEHTGEPALEPTEGEYLVPPAETVTLLRCTFATYADGTSIQVCLPAKDK